jgi:uncharacterized membrane protein
MHSWRFLPTHNKSATHTMKTFLSLLGLVFLVTAVFSMLTFVFFRGHIKNADSLFDYLYISIATLTTNDLGDMVPQTDAVKLWLSMYTLSAYVFVLYIALNHIRDIRIPSRIMT